MRNRKQYNKLTKWFLPDRAFSSIPLPAAFVSPLSPATETGETGETAKSHKRPMKIYVLVLL